MAPDEFPWFSRADAPPALPHPRAAGDEPLTTAGAEPPPGAGAEPPPGAGAEPPPGAASPGALVAFAVGRIAQGRRPEQAFCDLVELGTDRRIAAIAVCVANGTPWPVAESRMTSFDDVWASLGGGSAETAGGLLELYGYFDREVELGPDDAAIATALRQAMSAVEYLPSGYANQMYRLLRTGRLREALFSLEEMGAQRWPDHGPFWSSLTEAAARLDSAAILDTEVAAVRRRCESRAAPTAG
jgi:hypothetical protein